MTSDPFGDFDISCFADADGRTSRYLPCFIFHLVYHCCSWDKRTPPTLNGGDFFMLFYHLGKGVCLFFSLRLIQILLRLCYLQIFRIKLISRDKSDVHSGIAET